MATAQNLIDQLRRFMVDTTDEAYTDTTLLGYLAEAIQRFASETHCNQAIVTLTVTTNKSTFAQILAEITDVTPEALKVIVVGKVRLNDSAGDRYLPKAPVSEMTAIKPATVLIPTRWYQFAESIFFDLDSAVSGASNVMDYFCSYVPGSPSINETVHIPDQWHPALVHYMEFCCRSADRDAGLANGAFGQYEIIRAEAREFYKAFMES